MRPTPRTPKALIAMAAATLSLTGCGQNATPPPGSPAAPPAASSVTTSPATSILPTAAAPTGEPITGLTGRIVFTRAGGAYGDEALFVANVDGSHEIRLGGEEVCCPWASQDGSLLVWGGWAVQGERTAATFAASDGSGERMFPLHDGLALGSGPLSRDGKQIVMEGFTYPGFEGASMYIANVDGSKLRVLTTTHYIPGDFSPDGKTVLLFKEGPPGDGPPAPGSLWLIEADGSNARQLTPDDRPVQCCFNFRWSPDGSKIIFASPDGGLWTILPDGSGLTEVFHTGASFAITPTWSPDGSMILFGLDPIADPFSHPVNALYVIRADGSGLTKVIGGPNFKREPIWLPPAGGS